MITFLQPHPSHLLSKVANDETLKDKLTGMGRMNRMKNIAINQRTILILS
jgi:hypothetical protein